MSYDRLSGEYFDWLCDNAYDFRKPSVSFDRLLNHLHDIEFRPMLARDENCAEHGVYLRYQFAGNRCDEIEGPCSVLELMMALAIRCERDIMDDTAYGDRTSHWFWGMVTNLGLGYMDDRRYDEQYVDEVIERFLNRDYDFDGRGGLFRVRNTDQDMRAAPIFNQMCWYLDTII